MDFFCNAPRTLHIPSPPGAKKGLIGSIRFCEIRPSISNMDMTFVHILYQYNVNIGVVL